MLHFPEDTPRKLRVKRWDELKQERRTVPGWDPRNDRNGDERVDDHELQQLANPRATARTQVGARVPGSHWDPGHQQCYLNLSNPAARRFIAENDAGRLQGTKGFVIDWCTPYALGISPTMMGAPYLGKERTRNGTEWHKKYCLFDAMDYDIGKSLGPYRELDREELPAPVGQIAWKLLARDYEHALVLVKLADRVGDDTAASPRTATRPTATTPARRRSTKALASTPSAW